MKITIDTKFNVGDTVYIAYHCYEFYACPKPYVITDVLVNAHATWARIEYEIEQDGVKSRVPEEWAFPTYAKCLKWCQEHY